MTPLTQLALDVQRGAAQVTDLYEPLKYYVYQAVQNYMHTHCYHKEYFSTTWEDLEQLCWVRILETIPKYNLDMGCEYATYATHQMQYALLSELHTKGAQVEWRTTSYDVAIHNATDEEVATLIDMIVDEQAANAFTEVEYTQGCKLITEAINKLPEELKLCLTTQLQTGSFTETAERLGLTPSRVRTHYIKACTALKALLNNVGITADFLKN